MPVQADLNFVFPAIYLKYATFALKFYWPLELAAGIDSAIAMEYDLRHTRTQLWFPCDCGRNKEGAWHWSMCWHVDKAVQRRFTIAGAATQRQDAGCERII